MIATLIKKQLLQTFSFVFYDRRKGKARTPKGIAGFSALYLLLFGYVGVFVGLLADTMCEPFFAVGHGWLYMALMSMMAILLGVLGSVFSTYVSLYRPRDNDLLLSMPIPTSHILLSRLLGVYLLGLMYELLVMIPAIGVMLVRVRVGLWGIVFSLLLPFVLSFFILVLSCLLGYLVALISSRLRHTKVLTMVLSIAFMVAYFVFYSKAYEAFGAMLADPTALGKNVKAVLYPFYRIGLASTGDGLSILMLIGAAALLTGLTYLLLSGSFIRLATANRGAPKAAYVHKTAQGRSPAMALLGKEFRRFTSSTVYMLNSGLGIVMMVVMAIFMLIKGDLLRTYVPLLVPGYGMQTVILTAIVSFTASMNMITAPSVSMEGRHVWLTRSLPVPTHSILYAKLSLHLVLTSPSTLLLCLCGGIALRLPWYDTLLAIIGSLLISAFFAVAGLALGLLFPMLDWVDETVPVKQSLAVFLALFGGWGVTLAMGGLYWLTHKLLTPLWFLLCALCLFVLATLGILYWIRRGGSRRFEKL